MNENVKKETINTESKRNFFPYVVWLQYCILPILFVASVTILNLPHGSNSSLPMIDFAIHLTLYGFAFSFFSLIINIVPVLVIIYQERNTKSSIKMSMKEIDKTMIPSATVFLISTIGVISGLIIYLI
ncbi:MAG: hypothetical protein ACTSO3_15605 [Candidatus Heimdallarchaeaceae archaeon]